MPVDPMMNPLMPTQEQMTFMYCNYPEYAESPVDMVVWLYQYAVFKEQQERQMQNALSGDMPYKQPPRNNKSKKAGKGGKNQEQEEDDEDVHYLNMRDLRKKKPEPTKLE